ncbi:MAG: DUF2029 domain-containing protein [Anaerolineales bacterium]|nr:DUF2029 domain-containing protein [Anaerolineales bacterium]
MKNARIDGQTLKTAATWAVILIAAGVCLAVLTRVNYQFSESNPGGNDFLARWMGARFALQGVQPYDDRVSLESQKWIYGHAADPARGEDLSRFAYPLYSMIVFLPFGLFEFTTARALWMTLLEAGTIAFAVLAAALAGWEGRRWRMAVWILFSLFGYFGFRAVINGNPVVLVSLFLACALFLLKREFPVPAGIFLALAAIKPQVVFFPLLWIALWSLHRKRFSVLVSLGVTLAVLIGVGMLFVPDWVILNIREILDYPAYTEPGNPAAAFGLWFGEAGHVAGWIFSMALLAGMVRIWIANRKGSYRNFLIVMGVTISAAPLLGIPFDPGNEYLLLLPIAAGLAGWSESSRTHLTGWILTLGGLFFGLWTLFLTTLGKGTQPVQNPIMLFPLPLFLLVWLGYVYFRGNRNALPAEV